METETEALTTELYRLFGRLRYALMETQAAMAQIAGRVPSVTERSQAKGEEHESSGWTGIPHGWRGQGIASGSRDSECPVDDSIKPSLPHRIP